MRTISDTITRLAAFRAAAATGTMPTGGSRLTALTNFGSNPGALHGHVYIPPSLARNAPLVVVLHGCTQTAEGYNAGAGWSEMADRHGFAVLFPEQQRQNNPNLCFNWFSPEDNRRGTGEALSIRQMVAAVVERQGIDPARVFITGLSAGGAMTSVMLATYPEVFAGGAIIAGLPYGCANSIPEAFDRMRGHGLPRKTELSALIRAASDHRSRWPTISVWHGTADATVSHGNAQAIVEQWRELHGVDAAPTLTERVSGHSRRAWLDGENREVIEEFTISGMGHGTPLDTLSDDGCGQSGAYMLEVNISSTGHICRFWDIADGVLPTTNADRPHPHETIVPALPSSARVAPPLHAPLHATDLPRAAKAGVRKVIEDALSAAGLMR